MTDDFKTNVLKFITGNLEEEEVVNVPDFKNVQATTNSLYDQIKTHFKSRVAYTDFIPSKNNKNQSLEYSVLACRGTLNEESEETGAFVILDREYNIVDIITHYSDGSLLGIPYCLNVDDKGNYYAIELVGSTYRIVSLNNLVLKPVGSNTYQAIKINTYNIPNTYSWEGMLKVFRNEGANKYFIVGNRDNGDGIAAGELTISDTNTWKYYTSSLQKSFTFAMLDNGYNVYWDSNGELHFQIAASSEGLIMLTKGSGVPMVATRYTYNEGVTGSQYTFIFANNTTGYYAETIADGSTFTTYIIYKVNLANNTYKIVYTDTGLYTDYGWLFFFKNINGIYFYKTFRTEDDVHEFEVTFGFINDTSIYEQAMGTFTASTFANGFCYPNVITDFNKNYIYIQNQNTLFSLDFIWNSNDYNGDAYTSTKSLIPSKITIEDENETEIFNRNIYNLSSYSNWYTASVLIPNYFLNNVNLDTTLLYSKANNLMCSKYINTQKNIYEELNINFINKFNVKVNGDINIQASNGLVEAMLQENRNIYMGKIKINYSDDTSEIKVLSTKDLVYQGLTTTLKFVVYTKKQVDTIEIISNDETITYKTIPGETLDLNKYFLFEQELRIE